MLKKVYITLIIFLTIAVSCSKNIQPNINLSENLAYINNLEVNSLYLALQLTNSNTTQANNYDYVTYYDQKSKNFTTIIDYYKDIEGRIIIHWDYGWRMGLKAKPVTITFNELKFKDQVINGKVTINFHNFTQMHNPTFKIYSEITIKTPNSILKINSEDLITFEKGFYTSIPNDDYLVLNGKRSGTFNNAKFITKAINLTFTGENKKFIPLSGSEVVITKNNQEIIINYGDGNFDTKILITNDKEATEIAISRLPSLL